MIFHRPRAAAVECHDLTACRDFTEAATWIDLLEPTSEEETALEQALGIDVPTRDEIQDIATSSRLYRRDDALFMTATILTKSDTSRPEASAILFILTPSRLITVRYATPSAFDTFRARRDGSPDEFSSPGQVFGGLTDTIVERVADILEAVGKSLDELSPDVFRRDKRKTNDFREMLERLGRFSDLTSKTRESLLSLSRFFSFFLDQDKQRLVPESERAALDGHAKTVMHDLAALSDHSAFLSSKIAFLLDATLGLINVEQNAIIKIFSVAAVVFLPPTLVASIYGMNFQHMPELAWRGGYPFAILLMIGSAILPFYFFKRKGWL
ncbi:MAG: magnesium transporter [Polyangiaceae bacterium]|jgi:magnesium transporter|nr:magnesium transporter [Polyangiaceae bacterium]